MFNELNKVIIEIDHIISPEALDDKLSKMRIKQVKNKYKRPFIENVRKVVKKQEFYRDMMYLIRNLQSMFDYCIATTERYPKHCIKNCIEVINYFRELVRKYENTYKIKSILNDESSKIFTELDEYIKSRDEYNGLRIRQTDTDTDKEG